MMARGTVAWSLRKPITDRRIDPDTKPPRNASPPKLRLWGAPGQYVPASFVLRSPREVSGVRIDAGALRCGKHRIGPGQLDLRVVKCWYMAGIGVWAEPRSGRELVFDVNVGDNTTDINQLRCADLGPEDLWLAPELMVKDDYLFDIDRKRAANIFRFTGRPTDAKELQPVELRAGESKQMWLTVHIPADAAPGRYSGLVRVRVPRGGAIEIPVSLEVLPIQLSRAALDYMIYYMSTLTTRWGHVSHQFIRTPEQMRAELADMRAHGIDNTNVAEWIDGDRPDGKHFDFTRIDQVMDLREEAGFPVREQPLFWNGGPKMLRGLYKHDPWKIGPQELREIERTTKALLRWARRRGIPEVYVYGIDEVQEQKLKQEIRANEALKHRKVRDWMRALKGVRDVQIRRWAACLIWWDYCGH